MPMNVSFDSSLWREPKGKAGRPQWVYWAFRCDGCLYTIPALYHFEQGLVFDVLQPLSERELNLFYQKYQRYDGEGDPLPSALEHQIEQESPVRRLSLQNICVDGLVCTDFSSSASARTPWNQEALVEWREAYADCLQQQFFACQRFCLPYKHQGTQENIGSLALTVREREVFYPLSASFFLGSWFAAKKIDKVASIRLQEKSSLLLFSILCRRKPCSTTRRSISSLLSTPAHLRRRRRFVWPLTALFRRKVVWRPAA